MPWTFVAAASGANDAAGTTLSCSTSLNVMDGDLLVAWVGTVGGDTDPAVAKDVGLPTNAFTFDPADKASFASDQFNSWGYVLSATGDATATFKLTTPSRTFRHFIVMQFRPEDGFVAVKDEAALTSGTGTAVASPAIDTSGNDEVVCGGYGEYHPINTTSELINGASATEPSGSPAGNCSAWYAILSSTFIGGNASATIAEVRDWVCGIIAFRAEGVLPIETVNVKEIGDLRELLPENTPERV